MKKYRRFCAALLVCVFLTQSVFAQTDETIFTDPVTATLTGRSDANAVINNLGFIDLDGHWAKEPAARAVALGILKGKAPNFFPNANVSNGEMLAAVIRMLGRESDAITENARYEQPRNPAVPAPPNPPNTNAPVTPDSLRGYLVVATQLRLITNAQYNDTINADQDTLDPVDNFRYLDPVTRQQAVEWLYYALNQTNANSFPAVTNTQKIYNFPDWNLVRAVNLAAMESFVSNGIIRGDSRNMIRPNDYLTNAELAQMLKNLDSVYYAVANLQKRTGTVGGIQDDAAFATGAADLGRSVYVRGGNGRIEVLTNSASVRYTGNTPFYDIPVYRDGKIGGLDILREGDEIEYILNTVTNEVMYISVTSLPLNVTYVTGRLRTVDFNTGQITVSTENGTLATFVMSQGIYYNDTASNEQYLYIDYNRQIARKDLPFGSSITLRLKNDVCDEIYYVGDPVLKSETRGIVIENDPGLGYITLLDSGKNQVTLQYTADISNNNTKKKEYYMSYDEIGYITELFPYYKFNQVLTSIDNIEAGDIVFVKLSDADPEYIESIYAVTNYIPRYGTLSDINLDPSGNFYNAVLMDSDWRGQDLPIILPTNIFITKNGAPVPISELDKSAGAGAKVTMNEFMLSGNTISYAAKEIKIEG
ncbi:hypothetical protein FACS1894188_04860 [Clostridia bacterium]|nr:hypothetical protein FACS1894188_04860 [Clostridia bacterium]